MRVLLTPTCASLPRLLFFPANYFINKIYSLFPCNIASSKHAGSWGNTRVALGNHGAPTPLVFSQLPACLDEAILHGNALYISYCSSLVALTWYADRTIVPVFLHLFFVIFSHEVVLRVIVVFLSLAVGCGQMHSSVTHFIAAVWGYICSCQLTAKPSCKYTFRCDCSGFQ